MISVIIPNYNQEKYVAQAIQSALSQSYPADEIIVVDDGSTDNSSEIARSYGEQVRYIWQENKGLAGARNTGIRASHGDFIALLDADDKWCPTFLETMLTFANQNPDAGVYYSRAQAMDGEGNTLPQIFGGPANPPKNLYKALLRANFIIPSTVLMRRTAVIQAGVFDQNLRSCEDWDLWLRLLPTWKIIGTSDILVRYRIHGSSLSTDPAGMQNAHRSVVEKHFGLDDENPESWSEDKRRAYGGMYRYHALTSIQRKDDWVSGSQYLARAFNVDPSLSKDLDLFYELILGAQSAGYRGSVEKIAIEENEAKVVNLLDLIFQSHDGWPKSFKRQAYGTACYAIGLYAYNTGHLSLSRKYLGLAGRYRPDLLFSSILINNWLKSWLGYKALAKLRRLK